MTSAEAIAPRRIPGTDLAITPVGLGAWVLGGLWWGPPVDRDLAVATIRRAIDLGINWIDTAPLYGHGRADELVREAVGARRDVIIATKVGVRWDGAGAHARSDLNPSHLRDDVDASLRRLGRDALDLVQIHWPCEGGTPIEDSIAALAELRQQGKIRHLGVCNYDPDGLRQVLRAGPVQTLQTPYSMVRREFEGGLREAIAAERPIGVLAYEPLCRGLLTGKFQATARFGDDDLRARDDRFRGPAFLRALAMVGRLEWIARRASVPVAALAIAWVARQPGITAAIAGARSPAQVEANVLAHQLLQRDDLPWAEIDRIVAGFGPARR